MGALILASASKTRQAMLTNAGVPYRAIPVHIDEESVKAGLEAEAATEKEDKKNKKKRKGEKRELNKYPTRSTTDLTRKEWKLQKKSRDKARNEQKIMR